MQITRRNPVCRLRLHNPAPAVSGLPLHLFYRVRFPIAVQNHLVNTHSDLLPSFIAYLLGLYSLQCITCLSASNTLQSFLKYRKNMSKLCLLCDFFLRNPSRLPNLSKIKSILFPNQSNAYGNVSHILAPRRGCFDNHLLLRRVRIFVPLRSVHNKRHWRFAPLRSIYYFIGRNFL